MAYVLVVAAAPAASAVPVRCTGTSNPLAAGYDHTVSLNGDGTVWAWGSNWAGQLGDGSTLTRTRAVRVAGLTGIVSVTAGSDHSMALAADGTVWAWGYNGSGELGDGSSVNRVLPVQVTGLTDVVAVSAASSHSMALTADGTVWAWGSNSDGKLGTGNGASSLVPVQVAGLTDIIAIEAANHHSLALERDGTVWSWGWNGYMGLLGSGTWADSTNVPTTVPLTDVRSISAGDYHSLAVRGDGTVWTWGANESGQLGDGSFWDQPTPVQAAGLTGVTYATGGARHSLARKADGTLWAWGDNYDGAVGNGAMGDYLGTPVQSAASGVVAMAGGGSHSVSLNTAGTVADWGGNSWGQLGDGTTTSRATPYSLTSPKITKPAAPSEISAVAGEELAYVTWKPPAASVVTQYVVTPYLNGIAQPEIATDRPSASFAVKPLTKGATYSFVVTAQNCLGAGTPSTQSNRVVPTGVQLNEEGFTVEGEDITDRLRLKVNTFNGNVNVSAHDVGVPGTGLNLVVDRSYNSRATNTSMFGNNWATTVGDVRVDLLADGAVLYTAADGGQAGFARNPDGTFATPAGIDGTLSEDAGGTTYTLVEHGSGERRVFDRTSGRMIRQVDRNGNTLSFEHNAAGGRLSAITDTQQRRTTFAYNSASLVSTITDPAGRVHQYTYDGASNLTRYTDPTGGVTTFAYANRALTRITTPAGRVVELAYDSLSRATAVKWPLATGVPTTTFSYGGSRTVVTDANGNATTYHFDPVGRTVKVVDALGNQASVGYTSRSNVQRLATGGGGASTFGYAKGEVTSAAVPTGATAKFEYADAAHPHLATAMVDPQGNRTTFAYDPKGNVRAETVPLPSQNKVEVTYNPNGTASSSKDANGNVTAYAYDPAGNLSRVTPPAPLGAVTMSYDGLSRVVRVVDGNGQATTFGYDDLDRTTKVTYADGMSVARSYDPDGNITQVVDPTGTTTMSYDAMGRLASRSTPDGETTAYAYDKVGNLTAVTTLGGTVAYQYNAVNLPVRIVEPGGATTTTTYDASYNRTSVTLPNGVTTSYARDPSHRVTRITATKGAATLWSSSYSYANPSTGNTDSGLRFVVTGADGNPTTYTYDQLNRLVRARTADAGDQLVLEYQYTYDGNGNRLTRTVTRPSPAGPVSTTDRYAYNAANQLTNVNGEVVTYDGMGNMTGTNAGVVFTYNAAGQTTSIQPRPDHGTPATFIYRETGQHDRVAGGAGGEQLSTGGSACAPLLPCVDDPNRAVSPATFNSTILGLARETVASQSKHFVRDPQGNLVGQRDVLGARYFITDAIGSVVGVTGSDGSVLATFEYDPFGVLVRSTGDVASTPFRFAGAYLDPTGLYKIGQRYYDASLGRWTQQDSVVNVLDPLQWNRYVYVANNPVNFTDPDGESICKSSAAKFVRGVFSPLSLVGLASYGYASAGQYYAKKLAFSAAERMKKGLGLFSKISLGLTAAATAFDLVCMARGE